MTISEANDIIDAYLFWEDNSCSCHTGHPPCSKCTGSPMEEDYDEAREYLQECELALSSILAQIIIEEIKYLPVYEEAKELALEYEGIYDLFVMWSEETDEVEKQEILKNIREMVEDCNISYCKNCFCMTKTVEGKCVKCKEMKNVKH